MSILFQSADLKQQQDHFVTQAKIEPVMVVQCSNPLAAQAVALFNQLDDRGQVLTLALLATAVKLHPKVAG